MSLFSAKRSGILEITAIILATLFAVAVFFRYKRNQDVQGEAALPPLQPDLLLASPAELKRHALDLFVRYTISNKPQWESWKDKCEVHLVDNCGQTDKERAHSQFHIDRSLQIPPQVEFANEVLRFGDASNPVLQIVYYNDAAAASILNQRLFSGSILESRRKQLIHNQVSISDLSIPDFDPGSVVVKTIWQAIYPDPSTPTHYKAFYPYNNAVKPTHDVYPHLLPAMVNWPPALVDPAQPKKCEQKQDAQGIHIYSLGCFLFHEISAEELDNIPDDIINYLVRQECLKNKCYLLFMGTHMMTRETPNWVWMTFWWTNEGRPTSISNKWDFFDAEASINNQLSDTAQRSRANQLSTVNRFSTTNPYHSIANPYLEGPTSGMDPGCLDCHRFAAYNPSFKSDRDVNGYGLNPSYAHSKQLQEPLCYFKDSLRTHFLWTIAIHQNNSIPQSNDPCAKTRPSK
jgi:hypothetical protein